MILNPWTLLQLQLVDLCRNTTHRTLILDKMVEMPSDHSPMQDFCNEYDHEWYKIESARLISITN
jgi:hypothetical protein